LSIWDVLHLIRLGAGVHSAERWQKDNSKVQLYLYTRQTLQSGRS